MIQYFSLKSCIIVYTYENIIYTDIDYVDEKRKKKAQLLGLGRVSKYKLDDLPWIEKLVDQVVLLNGNMKVSKNTLAFEVILNRITDLSKLVVLPKSIQLYSMNREYCWDFKGGIEQYTPEKLFNEDTYNKLFYITPDDVQRGHWNTMMMTSWIKFWITGTDFGTFKVKEPKELDGYKRTASGQSGLCSSYLVGSSREYSEKEDDFVYIDIEGFKPKEIYDLFIESKYAVTLLGHFWESGRLMINKGFSYPQYLNRIKQKNEKFKWKKVNLKG